MFNIFLPNVQNEGGEGVKGVLNNVKKNYNIGKLGHLLELDTITSKKNNDFCVYTGDTLVL